MRALRAGIAVLLFGFGTAIPLPAQFYAPATEYHDLMQRSFVVELARILAWREPADKGVVTQIAYDVQVDDARQVTWNVAWLRGQTQTIHQVSAGRPDAALTNWLRGQAQTVRQIRIQYPETALTNGPAFYREVFRQMWKLGWRQPPRLSEDKLFQEFWHGAHQVGFSRIESVRTAWNMLDANLPEEKLAPRLAGLLQHAALPGFGGAVSLDAVLLARGAAWLCLAEAMLAEKPGGSCDLCWAPALFLAGRENSAVELWRQSRGDPPRALPPNEIARGWQFLMRRPRAREAFLYAAREGNERFALPLMIYYARTADLHSALDETLPAFFARNPFFHPKYYDYGPYLSLRAGVESGRLLDGAWPALARRAWLAALRDLPAEHCDYLQFKYSINKALTRMDQEMKHPSPAMDASLLGLAAVEPILRRDFYECEGKLAPVGVISSRDLLSYGWESGGLQLMARYRFVKERWGKPDLAQPIWTSAAHAIFGFAEFAPRGAPRFPDFYQNVLFRLQYLDLATESFSTLHAHLWGENTADDARLFYRRCWLRSGQLPVQSALLACCGPLTEVLPMLKRQQAEGGPLMTKEILQFLVHGMTPNQAGQLPGKKRFQEELAQAMPEPTILQVNTLWEKHYAPMSPWERGRTLETLFWEHPTVRVHEWVYENYLLAHADQAARRFYDQVSAFLQEPIEFSNGLGLERFVQAYLDEDQAALDKVLNDCDSGSLNYLNMLMWHALIREDFPALEQEVDEAVDRYGSAQKNEDPMWRLKKFLPLIPALKDPQHSERAKALDYFANDSAWPVIQWIMVRQFRLNLADAVRFLGGENTDVVRRLLVFYLRQDKPNFEQLYHKFSRTDLCSSSRFALATCLRNRLLEVPAPADQPDLKPNTVELLSRSVLTAMGAAGEP